MTASLAAVLGSSSADDATANVNACTPEAAGKLVAAALQSPRLLQIDSHILEGAEMLSQRPELMEDDGSVSAEGGAESAGSC